MIKWLFIICKWIQLSGSWHHEAHYEPPYICPMKIDIVSVVPQLMESFFAHSILKRAKEKGLLQVGIYNLRDYTHYKHGQVDDYQFGGGAGLVMMVEPLVNAIESLQKDTQYDEVIFLTPDGEKLNQKLANTLSLKNNLLLICGHYKGIDLYNQRNFHWRLCIEWWRIRCRCFGRCHWKINSRSIE